MFLYSITDGDPILAEFLVKYDHIIVKKEKKHHLINDLFRFSDKASALSVSTDDLYNALLADAEQQPKNWDLQGREVDIWKSLGSFDP